MRRPLTGTNKPNLEPSRRVVPALVLPVASPQLSLANNAIGGPETSSFSSRIADTPRTGRGGKEFEERYERRKIAAQATHRSVTVFVQSSSSI